MALSRRRFLALTALPIAPWVSAALGSVGATQAPADPAPRLLSARGDGAGGYRVSALDSAGRLVLDQPLPGRGHGLALRPDGRQAVCLARRPGDFLLTLDMAGGTSNALHRTPADRHCFGHAVFSPDGHRLYTTENASDSGEGCIGVWDTADGYRRLGELPSHGIDPHEVLLAPGGEALIVANGGILTRPETGRAKLNLETMQPSLVYLDRRNGELLTAHRLAPQWHQLSIRHLALGRDGIVCCALQYEGPAADRPPLVAFQRPGLGLELAAAPADIQAAMRNYCGSVAADPSGAWFAVSSPRGNLVTFWGSDGRFQGSTQVTDGCGVAPGDAPGTFFISSGTGTLHRHECMTGATARLPGPPNEGIAWDNHLTLCA